MRAVSTRVTVAAAVLACIMSPGAAVAGQPSPGQRRVLRRELLPIFGPLLRTGLSATPAKPGLVVQGLLMKNRPRLQRSFDHCDGFLQL